MTFNYSVLWQLASLCATLSDYTYFHFFQQTIELHSNLEKLWIILCSFIIIIIIYMTLRIRYNVSVKSSRELDTLY